MRIAILNLWSISENAIGGTERFVDDFSMSLAKHGHTVDVYMFSGTSFQKGNVNFISLDLFGKGVIADEYMIQEKFGDFNTIESYDKVASLLKEKIDASIYDFIHLNSHFFLKCFSNKKRILTMHSNYQEFMVLGTEDAYQLMIDILKEEINHGLKVVCPSLYYGKEWSKILGSPVYTIYHAINQDRLKCNISKEELIKKYGLSSTKIKILLPSRLEPIQKRPKLVLEALKDLKIEERTKYQVIFTGIDTQYEPYVKELDTFSKEYNIDSKFIMFDHISEGYQLCDIVCVPSKSESFGYSAIEGISLGIPTILSSIPTYLELKGDNSNVYIFQSISDFRDILEELSHVEIIERGVVSSVWLDQFDLDEFGDKYVELL